MIKKNKQDYWYKFERWRFKSKCFPSFFNTLLVFRGKELEAAQMQASINTTHIFSLEANLILRSTTHHLPIFLPLHQVKQSWTVSHLPIPEIHYHMHRLTRVIWEPQNTRHQNLLFPTVFLCLSVFIPSPKPAMFDLKKKKKKRDTGGTIDSNETEEQIGRMKN